MVRNSGRLGRLSALRCAALGVLLAVGACAPSRPPALPIPTTDGASLAQTLEQTTRLERPSMVQFDWKLNERGARVSGRGVARAQPLYRARLDLFDGSGETVARAGLKDGELCLPAEAPEDIIPPPGLLWAALGVFRPGPSATLLGAGRSGEQVELRYSAEGGRELRYYVEGEKVREVELLEDGRVLHRVTLTPSAIADYPADATYRNLASFRQLEMVTRSMEHVESFASDTWLPPC